MMITVAIGPRWGPGAFWCGGSTSSSSLCGSSLVTLISSHSCRHGLQEAVSVLLECEWMWAWTAVRCPDELRWCSLAFYQQPSSGYTRTMLFLTTDCIQQNHKRKQCYWNVSVVILPQENTSKRSEETLQILIHPDPTGGSHLGAFTDCP